MVLLSLTNLAQYTQTGYTHAFPMTARCCAATGNEHIGYKWGFEGKLKKYRDPRFVNTKLQLVQHTAELSLQN